MKLRGMASLVLATAVTASAGAQAPGGPSSAAPAKTAAPAASSPSGSPSAAPSASAASPAPSGSAREMPPGHPPMPSPRRADPSAPYRPPPNKILVNEDIEVGTIDVELLDADDQPLPNTPFKLRIKFSSVTKGDSKRDVEAVTDARGRYRFTDQDTGTGIAYSVVAERGEAVFTSQAFGLKQKGGIEVHLHVFDSTNDLARTPFVIEQATVLMEVKPDRIAVNHLLRTLNLGREAFVPANLSIALPADFKAFTNEQQMGGDASTATVVERDGSMVLEGTFPPGRTDITFSYEMPLDGEETKRLTLPLPPRVLSKRVVVGAGPDMNMVVAGFPKAQVGRWSGGKRVLYTTQSANMGGSIEAFLQNLSPQTVDITLTGVPTPGPERNVALAIAIAMLALGLAYVAQQRGKKDKLTEDRRRDLEEARDRLLGEMAMLEKAHAKGDVGPRSYERLRTALLDAIGRIMTELGEAEDDDASHPYRRRGKKRKKKKRVAAEA